MRQDRILFLDIETVSEHPSFEDLDGRLQHFWSRRARRILKKEVEDLKREELATSYIERAGIYAEFAKIVCISVGYFKSEAGRITEFRTKSFAGDDEKTLLLEFADLLNTHFKDSNRNGICGHNIKEFDIPFICRRMTIHQIILPDIIDIRGKKPWETQHLIDTMELWKFGDWKAYTSLDLLSHIFGIPSPKDDIDGSMVGRIYWEHKDLDRISAYCEKDVITTARLWCKMNLKEWPDENEES